jgi:hypothetical protein
MIDKSDTGVAHKGTNIMPSYTRDPGLDSAILLRMHTREPRTRRFPRLSVSIVALLGGFVASVSLASQRERAPQAGIPRPHWVSVATIIDLTTAERLKESYLDDPRLEFDDPNKCNSTVTTVGAIPPQDDIAVILTCHEVGPQHTHL